MPKLLRLSDGRVVRVLGEIEEVSNEELQEIHDELLREADNVGAFIVEPISDEQAQATLDSVTPPAEDTPAAPEQPAAPEAPVDAAPAAPEAPAAPVEANPVGAPSAEALAAVDPTAQVVTDAGQVVSAEQAAAVNPSDQVPAPQVSADPAPAAPEVPTIQ